MSSLINNYSDFETFQKIGPEFVVIPDTFALAAKNEWYPPKLMVGTTSSHTYCCKLSHICWASSIVGAFSIFSIVSTTWSLLTPPAHVGLSVISCGGVLTVEVDATYTSHTSRLFCVLSTIVGQS